MQPTDELENLAYDLSMTRSELADKVQALHDEIAQVKRKHIEPIKALASHCATKTDALRVFVNQHRDLFDKQRTRTLHGIKVGLQKQRGKVIIRDEERTIRLIRKLLPADQAELLIRVRESVHKPAVYDLSTADLKRIAIEIEADGDAIVVKGTESDIDKLVAALQSEELDDLESLGQVA